MENLLMIIAVALILALTASTTCAVFPESFLESGANSNLESVANVFEKGKLETVTKKVKKSKPTRLYHPLYIVSPKKPGLYPVLFFIHGTIIPNKYYSELFEHISSHGFVVVAPQLYTSLPMYQSVEIERAVFVANWLVSNLDSVLPEGVKGDLIKFAVSGHSRGGKTAFALALGMHHEPLDVKISAVIGVDPVAAPSKNSRTLPYILTYVPNSFDLSIPVTVIGTGLGNQTTLGQACAPNEVSHEEFYNECKNDCTHFVVDEYGHMDMLNADISMFDLISWGMAKFMCANGEGDRSVMRRTVGGIMVAFLDAYFLDDRASFDTILAYPSVAPAKLNPVQAKSIKINQQAQKCAQI